MSKQSNNGAPGSKTLSQQDKEMGFQLLLSPKTTVNVHTPLVAHELTHLYPKLAGPNWTCYITGDIIRLGRRPEHAPPIDTNNNNNSNNNGNNKILADVDFCGNKQVSRRHADIKFNIKKNYWELRVYGRIGVKVNHNLVTKKQHPVPLTAMAYLDIGGNGFVFVLPDQTDGAPGKADTQLSTSASETAPAPDSTTTIASQTDTILENEKNDQLVTLIIDVLESLDKKTTQRTTEQIFMATIQLCRKKSLDSSEYTMDAVLRALVFDPRFKVTKECLEMTAQQSDKVRWCWELPPLPVTTETATLDTPNSEGWSELDDFMDVNDHLTGETNENLSTTTGTPTPIDGGPWLSSNLSETTATTNTRLPLSSSAAAPSVSTPTTSITSPSLSSGYPGTENENYFSTMTSAPLSQTTNTTIPSVVSSSINRSIGERTLSGLSNMDDGPISPLFKTATMEAPETSSDKTPWTQLELYHVSALPDQHAAIPGYSRGLSLLDMYSSILATRQHSGMEIHESTSFSTPCTLFPTTPDDVDDDDNIFDMTRSNGKRKRYSTSDHEDRTLWTRFRTTLFKYKD